MAVLWASFLPNPYVFNAKSRSLSSVVVEFLSDFGMCLSIWALSGSISSGLAITMDAPTDMATNRAEIFIFLAFFLCFFLFYFLSLFSVLLFHLIYFRNLIRKRFCIWFCDFLWELIRVLSPQRLLAIWLRCELVCAQF